MNAYKEQYRLMITTEIQDKKERTQEHAFLLCRSILNEAGGLAVDISLKKTKFSGANYDPEVRYETAGVTMLDGLTLQQFKNHSDTVANDLASRRRGPTETKSLPVTNEEVLTSSYTLRINSKAIETFSLPISGNSEQNIYRLTGLKDEFYICIAHDLEDDELAGYLDVIIQANGALIPRD